MTRQELFDLYAKLSLEHQNCLIEYDEQQAELLELFANEIARSAVNKTLDEALNSGDGSYRP